MKKTPAEKIAAKIVSLAGGTSPTPDYVADVERTCRILDRASKRLDRLNEQDCNEPSTPARERDRIALEASVREAAEALYPAVVRFEIGGDPRGASVRLFLRDGSSNSWDGESWRFA